MTVTKYQALAENLSKWDSNPVLDIGAPGEWDDANLGCFSLLRRGNTFFLWYMGSREPDPHGKPWKIGLATSTDGVHWMKSDANPLFPGAMPYVARVDDLFYMWYCGRGGLNLTTSSDGVRWNEHSSNPVLPRPVADPCVLRVGQKFYLWYLGHSGGSYRVNMATSLDGVKWEQSGVNPVLPLGKKGAFDSVHHAGPTVLQVGDMFFMWYLGCASRDFEGGWRMGFATSPDGTNWQKSPANPVLDAGEKGAWDQDGLLGHDVLQIGDSFHIWYAGSSARKDEGETIRIGYARSKQED